MTDRESHFEVGEGHEHDPSRVLAIFDETWDQNYQKLEADIARSVDELKPYGVAALAGAVYCNVENIRTAILDVIDVGRMAVIKFADLTGSLDGWNGWRQPDNRLVHWIGRVISSENVNPNRQYIVPDLTPGTIGFGITVGIGAYLYRRSLARQNASISE